MVDDTEQTLLLRATAAYLDVIRAKGTVTLRDRAAAYKHAVISTR